MPCIPPFEEKTEGKSLHLLWNLRIYKFLRDFFSTVAMGPAEEYDEFGNPAIVKHPGTGMGWIIPYEEGYRGYAGMFAIRDETEYGDDGTASSFTVRVLSGIAHVNGTEHTVADTVDTFTSTADRIYYLLAATEDDGSGLAVFVGIPGNALNTYTNTPEGYTVRTRLRIGRVLVSSGVLEITQDYLAGSSNQLILAESCP